MDGTEPHTARQWDDCKKDQWLQEILHHRTDFKVNAENKRIENIKNVKKNAPVHTKIAQSQCDFS
jgi:hypothetical protein